MTQTKPPIAVVSDDVRELKGDRTTFRAATVVAANTTDRLIDVDVAGVGRVNGIYVSPSSFFPKVGDVGQVRLDGAHPSWVISSIGEGAIGEDELAEPVKQQIAVAVAAANGINTDTYSLLPPPAVDDGTGRVLNDPWWQLDEDGVIQGAWRWDGTAWQSHTFGNGVFDAIDAGKIVTGILGVGVRITLGDSTGVHTVLEGGRGVFLQTPGPGGVMRELSRFGRDVAIIDAATGAFLATMDSTGRVSGTSVYGDRMFAGGRDVAQSLDEQPAGEVGRFGPTKPNTTLGPIFSQMGICEEGAVLRKGRKYRIAWQFTAQSNLADDEMITKVIWSNGADGDTATQPPMPPVGSSNLAGYRFDTIPVADRNFSADGAINFYPTVTSRYRIGLTMERGAGSTLGTLTLRDDPVVLTIDDCGPAGPVTGGFSNLGGQLVGFPSPPPPPSVSQQYVQDIEPVGRGSWAANGSIITGAGNDVFQGQHVTRGNQRGQFWFDLPTITGTVDSVELYLYFRDWQLDSGGTAVLDITDKRGTDAFSGYLRGLWEVPGWPRPGGRWVTLPPDWLPFFKGTTNTVGNGRATTITLGPASSSSALFSGIATDATLRIKYTQ